MSPILDKNKPAVVLAICRERFEELEIEMPNQTNLPQPDHVTVEPSLFQKSPELSRDVEPHPSVVRDFPHKCKGLICLRTTTQG